MNPIQNILNRFPLMILDGAFATELEKRGCDLSLFPTS
jgi:homocysteine S-methyltransferase